MSEVKEKCKIKEKRDKILESLFSPIDGFSNHETINDCLTSLALDRCNQENMESIIFLLERLQKAFLYSYLHYLKIETSKMKWEQLH